jgi:PPE-repeat protein
MLMLDFGALPPEINSARMYVGAGSAPMLAAATAWDALAAQLELFGAGYSEALSALHGESWSGPSSTAMAAAAEPYVAWATATSAQAGAAAHCARAAASAFETAFLATVHPAVVAANRVQLAALVATNFFGQNTAAIAATEATYAEMWAQDAAAMYNYAASSSAATDVTPFIQAPQSTNPIAQSGQGDAVTQAAGSIGHSQGALSQLMSAVPQQLQTFASGGATNASTADSSATSTSVLTAIGDLNTVDGPLNLVYQIPYTSFSGGTFYNGLTQSKIQGKDLPEIAEEDAGKAAEAGKLMPEGGDEPALAAVGRAEPIGALSVPQNWTAAIPASDPVAEPVMVPEPVSRVLPPWTAHPTTTTPAGMPSIGRIPDGAPPRGSNAVFRMRDRRYKFPRPALGG